MWGLVGLLAVLQVIAPNRVWIVLFVCLGGTLALSRFWAQQMARRVTLTRRQRYGWVHTGDLLEEQFELRNDSFLPALWVEIDDHSDLPSYSACSVRSAGGGESIDWRSEGICHERGLFTLGPWQAHLSDPFGFFDVTFDYRSTSSILVYPAVVHLPRILLPKGATSEQGRTSRPTFEVTANASGIRPYETGDDLRRIHWPSTARRDTLISKTFDLEPSGNVWLLLDLDGAVQAGEDEESTEEYAVILASSLAYHLLRENRAVGLVAYGPAPSHPYCRPSVGTERQPANSPRGPELCNGFPREREDLPTLIVPQKGMAQQWRILHALALVGGGGHRPLATVLKEIDRTLGRGVSLVVITPSTDATWPAELLLPMRRGIAPSAVLLDAASFGGAGNAPALQGLLADLGVPSQIVSRGDPFRPVFEYKRIGRPEYRVLSGTGRVIPARR